MLPADLMTEIASDEVIDEAYRWLCRRRGSYSHNNDVWTLRWCWDEIKRQVQAQLLAGEYRFESLPPILFLLRVLRAFAVKMHLNHEGAKSAKKKEDYMGYGESTSPELERIAAIVVDAIYKVHSTLGPGLLESVYSICLAHELRKRGLKVEREVKLPVLYDGVRLESGLRLDLVVDSCIIIEAKAVEKLVPVFDAQLLTYLKLTGHTLGFLVNFNVSQVKEGMKRVILSAKTPPAAVDPG